MPPSAWCGGAPPAGGRWRRARLGGGRAPLARCWGRWAGGTPLAACGCRGCRGREGPVLLQRLERPDPDTIGHAAPGDRCGFDGFEQLVLGRPVCEGAAHVGLDAIVETAGRQDPQNDACFHLGVSHLLHMMFLPRLCGLLCHPCFVNPAMESPPAF